MNECMYFFSSSCSSLTCFAHMVATWSLRNPCSRRNPDQQLTREVWATRFPWTPSHFTPDQLHPLNFSYDVLGEECLNRLDEISPPTHPGLPRNSSRDPVNEKGESAPTRDLYTLLRENAHRDEKLAELWHEVTHVPDWVDLDQIARGQEVFYRYGGPALTAVCEHASH